jgi:hypothetical protein
MPAPLTDEEKQRRGTFRADRTMAPRILAAIQADIADRTEVLRIAEQEATEATATVTREGTCVKTKDKRARSKTKPHPAITDLGRAQGNVRSAARALALIREEGAKAVKAAAEEPRARPRGGSS